MNVLARSNNKGIGLVEIVAALGVSVLVITALVSLSVFSVRSSLRGELALEATKVTNNEIELLRALRDSTEDWSDPVDGDGFMEEISGCFGSSAKCHMNGLNVASGSITNPPPPDPKAVTRYFYITYPKDDGTGTCDLDGTSCSGDSSCCSDKCDVGGTGECVLGDVVRANVFVEWVIGGEQKTTSVYTDFSNWRSVDPISLSGVVPTCSGLGVSCSGSNECCSGKCDVGNTDVCVRGCGDIGDSCTVQNDCCAGLDCNGITCYQPTPPPPGPSCANYLEACNPPTTDCCDSNQGCFGGICVYNGCNNNTDCAGISCSAGFGSKCNVSINACGPCAPTCTTHSECADVNKSDCGSGEFDTCDFSDPGGSSGFCDQVCTPLPFTASPGNNISAGFMIPSPGVTVQVNTPYRVYAGAHRTGGIGTAWQYDIRIADNTLTSDVTLKSGNCDPAKDTCLVEFIWTPQEVDTYTFRILNWGNGGSCVGGHPTDACDTGGLDQFTINVVP